MATAVLALGVGLAAPASSASATTADITTVAALQDALNAGGYIRLGADLTLTKALTTTPRQFFREQPSMPPMVRVASTQQTVPYRSPTSPHPVGNRGRLQLQRPRNKQGRRTDFPQHKGHRTGLRRLHLQLRRSPGVRWQAASRSGALHCARNPHLSRQHHHNNG